MSSSSVMSSPIRINSPVLKLLNSEDEGTVILRNAKNCSLSDPASHKWFKVNLLSINVDKTHYLQFKTKNNPICNINIACNDTLVTALPKIKFLGIYIQDSINWSSHIDYIIPKLSSACYAMRSIIQLCPFIH